MMAGVADANNDVVQPSLAETVESAGGSSPSEVRAEAGRKRSRSRSRTSSAAMAEERVFVNKEGRILVVPRGHGSASGELACFASDYLGKQVWLPQSENDVPADVLEKAEPSWDDALAALRRIPAPEWCCTSRNNVRPEGAETVNSAVLGLVRCQSTRGMPLPSKKTRHYPNLCRLLLRLLRQRIAGKEEPFYCTSIQLNWNYAARPHVDSNNRGPSCIIALGDWETPGGELWVEDADGEEEIELRHEVFCAKRGEIFRRGDRCRGTPLDIRERVEFFDGRRLHFVKPFTGERFSVVYFSCSHSHPLLPDVTSFLTDLGFILPPDDRARRSVTPERKTRKSPSRLAADGVFVVEDWIKEKKIQPRAPRGPYDQDERIFVEVDPRIVRIELAPPEEAATSRDGEETP